MIIDDVWTMYFASIKGKKMSYQKHYLWANISKVFAGKYPRFVTEETCRYYNKIRRAEGVTSGTVRNELQVLRTVLNWGSRRRKIINDDYQVWVPTGSPPRSARLTREQAKDLIGACQSDHLRLFIILALSTGARAMALFDLTWDRVDFERGLIDLRAPVEDYRLFKGRAVVPMTQTARTALLQAKEKARCNHVIEYRGQRIQRAIWQGFRDAAARAGVPWCTPHVLRHTAATWMVEGGAQMSEVSQFLGHADSRITERVYAKYSPTYLGKAARALEFDTG